MYMLCFHCSFFEIILHLNLSCKTTVIILTIISLNCELTYININFLNLQFPNMLGNHKREPKDSNVNDKSPKFTWHKLLSRGNGKKNI